MIMRCVMLAIVAGALSGCGQYGVVPDGPVEVARRVMVVNGNDQWNRMPRQRWQIAREERWTRNGPLLDIVTFLGDVPDGEDLAKYIRREERRIPTFRADMTPPELTAMVESRYRILGNVTIFETTGVAPAGFLNHDGIRMDYRYVGADGVPRLGRTYLAVIDERFYMMTLDGAELHYFNAALPDFLAFVQGADLN